MPLFAEGRMAGKCKHCNHFILLKSEVIRKKIVVGVLDLGFTTLLTSQVISAAFYSEREKFDKFCSEALISAEVLSRAVNLRHETHGFTFPPKEVILRQSYLYTLKKIYRSRPGFKPRTSNS